MNKSFTQELLELKKDRAPLHTHPHQMWCVCVFVYVWVSVCELMYMYPLVKIKCEVNGSEGFSILRTKLRTQNQSSEMNNLLLSKKKTMMHSSLNCGVQRLLIKSPQEPQKSCSYQLFKMICLQLVPLILTFYYQLFGSVDIWLILQFTITRQIFILFSYNTCWTNFYQFFSKCHHFQQRKGQGTSFFKCKHCADFDNREIKWVRIKKFDHSSHRCEQTFYFIF